MIESYHDYGEEIINNPIMLLGVIKQNSLNYQDKKYPKLIIMDTCMAFSTIRQKEGESLQDYNI
jgi:hypothetical protein